MPALPIRDQLDVKRDERGVSFSSVEFEISPGSSPASVRTAGFSIIKTGRDFHGTARAGLSGTRHT